MRVTLILALTMLASCYRVSYHQLSAAPNSKVSIDRNAPESSTRWIILWGGLEDEWTPFECTEHDADGDCIVAVPICIEGGPGRVTTTFGIHSALMMILTLGFAIPMEVTVYCNTDSTSGPGPSAGPTQPDDVAPYEPEPGGPDEGP